MTTRTEHHTSQLLSSTQIAAAAQIFVFDARGNRIRFGALFELQKTLFVFIRHFFCGKYVSQLTSVNTDALEYAGTKIVIVGCGEWNLIKNYQEYTCATRHPLLCFYADPTCSVYHALGMTTSDTLTLAPHGRSPDSGGSKRRKNIGMGRLALNAAKTFMRVLKNAQYIGKQGDIHQLGGEFILGPNNTCSFAHYMKHMDDHADVPRLLRLVGVE